MGSDMELMILEQLKELRAELRTELASARSDMRSVMIEVGALKAKVAAIGSVAGLIAAGLMQVASTVFFNGAA